jgi:type IV secretory pathway protease TraF
MLPNDRNGEVVLILRAAYGFRGVEGKYWIQWQRPSVGDVVAATSPSTKEIVIKRIGEIRTQGSASLHFLVGDNAIESVDSRDFGPVFFDAIVGKVIPQK